MKKLTHVLMILAIAMTSAVFVTGCQESQDKRDSRAANRQQTTFAIGQPIPVFEWSLERHLLNQLYMLRNQKVATHAVWRGMTSIIEGDCPAMGFPLPYDTSATNPLKKASNNITASVIEQAEPNGIYLSKNSEATWVMCINEIGSIDPILVETKVTTYPYGVDVNYSTNRVTKDGKSVATISKDDPNRQ